MALDYVTRLIPAYAAATNTAASIGMPIAPWGTLEAILTRHPLLAVKPAIEELAIRGGLAEALAAGDDSWYGIKDVSTGLVALLEALEAMKPPVMVQLQLMERARKVADKATGPYRLNAYYLAAAAMVYAP